MTIEVTSTALFGDAHLGVVPSSLVGLGACGVLWTGFRGRWKHTRSVRGTVRSFSQAYLLLMNLGKWTRVGV